MNARLGDLGEQDKHTTLPVAYHHPYGDPSVSSLGGIIHVASPKGKISGGFRRGSLHHHSRKELFSLLRVTKSQYIVIFWKQGKSLT